MPMSPKKYNEKYSYYGSTGSRISAANEIKSKADNVIKQNADNYKEKQNSKRNDDLSMPSFIKKNENDLNKSIEEKTNNIFNQINSYLDNEKKKLK